MENNFEFECPYCGEINNVEIFLSEGRIQKFVRDCEVCCRPVELTVKFDNDGFFNIEIKNDDGF